MECFPYQLSVPAETAATLGLIVLKTDETIEQDFRRLFRTPETSLFVTRIPSGADVTPETLCAMRQALPDAANLLPGAAEFDVIGYCCTSGATLIGPETVAQLVHEHARVRTVTNPLTAALAACKAVAAQSVSIVSPYIAPVATPIREAFERGGLTVPATLSFGEEEEERVARIDPGSIHAAALEVASRAPCDAVFLSCTNLRTLDIIHDLEDRLGLPVLSSNQVLAWHMAKSAPAARLHDAPGRLFRQ
ncbi:aspartate/glutamate racemase family protein [uncultured Roseobacter sp.]|uniref:maleate cis-trans isomerase family protein n=1 Tax=uncultured Roseobacter sp. TaxID=114847 RepID=UPI002638CF28|nr:aspartate/glutamate racemase family protein [uncultured Roseobacter sp.]